MLDYNDFIIQAIKNIDDDDDDDDDKRYQTTDWNIFVEFCR